MITLLLACAVNCGQTSEVQTILRREPLAAVTFTLDSAHDLDSLKGLSIISIIHISSIRHSRQVREGLALARAEVDYSPDPALAAALQPETEWYPGWLFYPFFSIFGYLAWCGICFALARWYRYGRRDWLKLALLLVPFSLLPPLNEAVRAFRDARESATPLVVAQKNTELRLGNGPDYPLLAPVPHGAECRFLSYRAGWCQVEFASGLTGWIPHGDLIGGIPP